MGRKRARKSPAHRLSAGPSSQPGVKHEVGSDSLWVFIACSNEARHLDDIIYGATTLLKLGVAPASILVFVDHPTPEAHLRPYGLGAALPMTHLVTGMQAAGPAKNVVVVVGGHGDVVGLRPSGSPTVGPSALLNAVRSVPGISVGVILLTQCYAGVFNYLDTRNAPPLVMVGGTNLNPSVSAPLRLKAPIPLADQTAGLQEWSANIFAFHFFNWLSLPMDVDGDGDVNLIDAYKYAGASSNSMLREAKTGLFSQVQASTERLKLVSGAALDPIAKKLLRDAIELERRRALDMLYLHQEPWVLNAHLARDVIFK